MAANSNQHEDSRVLRTPFWIVLIRGVIAFLCLGLIVLAGFLIHDAYLNEWGLNVAMALVTWLVLAYIVFSEKIPSLRSMYHIIALLTCDAIMIILWLSTFAATADKRAQFTQHVNVDGCYNDGAISDSEHCFTTRSVILFKSGLIIFAIMAVLGAVNWILFIVCFVWELMAFRRGRKEGRFRRSGPFNTAPQRHGSENYQMKPKASEPFLAHGLNQNQQPGDFRPVVTNTPYQQPYDPVLVGTMRQDQQSPSSELTGSASQNYRLASPEMAGSIPYIQQTQGSELTGSTTYHTSHPEPELPGSASYAHGNSFNDTSNYAAGHSSASPSSHDHSHHGGGGFTSY